MAGRNGPFFPGIANPQFCRDGADESNRGFRRNFHPRIDLKIAIFVDETATRQEKKAGSDVAARNYRATNKELLHCAVNGGGFGFFLVVLGDHRFRRQ